MRVKVSNFLVFLLGILGLKAAPVQADVMVICDPGGVLSGESTDPRYTGCVDITSWQWGVGRGISTGGGSGREATAPSFSEITVSKFADIASLALLENMTGGTKVFPKLELFQDRCTDCGTTRTPYIQLTMEEVLVSGFSESSGGNRPSESVSFNYTKVEWCYSRQDGKVGPLECVGYDLQTGKIY